MCLQQPCRQCGYDPSSNELSQRPWSSTIELETFLDGDIERIQADIDQLEKVALHIKVIQAKLRRKVNEIQSAPGKLPDEILSTIFSYACPTPSVLSPEQDSHFQLVLGAVSSRWRQIIWSTPKFWKVAVMDEWWNPDSFDHTIALLSLYVRNVGSCPLDLDFEIPSKSLLGESLADLTPFKDLVFRNAATKLRALNPRLIPAKWLSLLSGNCPNLQKLRVGKLYWPEQVIETPELPSGVAEVIITDVPNLHHLVYDRDFDRRVVFPWHQITILDIHRLSLSQVLHLLHLCPNVFKVSLDCFFSGIDDEEPDLQDALSRRPIRLDRLVDLQHTMSRRLCEVIRRLHFPVLGKLRWLNTDFIDAVRTGLELSKGLRPMPTVTCFSGNARYAFNAVKWKEVFTTYLPNLTHLELVALQLVPEIFLKILDPTSELGSEAGQLVLPRLEHLAMEIQSDTKKSAKQSRRLLVDLVTMLQNRRQISPEFNEFTLTVSEEIAKSRGRNVRKRLRKLVEDGLKLTILAETRLDNWLRK